MNSAGFTHERNQKDHWITPRHILSVLGEFDLDPCACELGQPWSTAKEMYHLPSQDGLLLPWHGRVWLNPPYGRETHKWIERICLHRRGTLLIFARTETKTFQRIWRFADAILFIAKRVQFYRPDGTRGGSSSAPSCLVAFGRMDAESLRDSGIGGALVHTWTVL
jgi:hypothetical protein